MPVTLRLTKSSETVSTTANSPQDGDEASAGRGSQRSKKASLSSTGRSHTHTTVKKGYFLVPKRRWLGGYTWKRRQFVLLGDCTLAWYKKEDADVDVEVLPPDGWCVLEDVVASSESKATGGYPELPHGYDYRQLMAIYGWRNCKVVAWLLAITQQDYRDWNEAIRATTLAMRAEGGAERRGCCSCNVHHAKATLLLMNPDNVEYQTSNSGDNLEQLWLEQQERRRRRRSTIGIGGGILMGVAASQVIDSATSHDGASSYSYAADISDMATDDSGMYMMDWFF